MTFPEFHSESPVASRPLDERTAKKYPNPIIVLLDRTPPLPPIQSTASRPVRRSGTVREESLTKEKNAELTHFLSAYEQGSYQVVAALQETPNGYMATPFTLPRSWIGVVDYPQQPFFIPKEGTQIYTLEAWRAHRAEGSAIKAECCQAADETAPSRPDGQAQSLHQFVLKVGRQIGVMLGMPLVDELGIGVPSWKAIDKAKFQLYAITDSSIETGLLPHPLGELEDAYENGVCPQVYARFIADGLLKTGWCY